jgi:hypothetical protein
MRLGHEMKHFLGAINEYSYEARVFVRLSWRSLPGPNNTAYYKNNTLQTKKFYNIFPWQVSISIKNLA